MRKCGLLVPCGLVSSPGSEGGDSGLANAAFHRLQFYRVDYHHGVQDPGTVFLQQGDCLLDFLLHGLHTMDFPPLKALPHKRVCPDQPYCPHAWPRANAGTKVYNNHPIGGKRPQQAQRQVPWGATVTSEINTSRSVCECVVVGSTIIHPSGMDWAQQRLIPLHPISGGPIAATQTQSIAGTVRGWCRVLRCPVSGGGAPPLPGLVAAQWCAATTTSFK